MQKNTVSIGGDLSSDRMERYGTVLGTLYGGGEYSVSESDLLDIRPDISNVVTVVGANFDAKNTKHKTGGENDTHSASTVEVELLNLFRFPRKIIRNAKKTPLRKKAKRKIRGKYLTPEAEVVRFGDVSFDIEETKGSTITSSMMDDYDVARELDKEAYYDGSEDSTGSENVSVESTDRESTSDESTNDDNTSNENTGDKNRIGSVAKSEESAKDTSIMENNNSGSVISSEDKDLNIFAALETN